MRGALLLSQQRNDAPEAKKGWMPFISFVRAAVKFEIIRHVQTVKHLDILCFVSASNNFGFQNKKVP